MNARVLPAFCSLASVWAVPAHAQDIAAGVSPVTLSAAFGYAYPMGSSELGTHMRDVSFGVVPLSLAAAYDLRPSWSAHLQVDAGASIPTLCSSSSDCVASIGHAIELLVGIGRSLPRWGRLDPRLEAALGWEWLTTRLSDTGVVSTRAWSGPVGRIDLFVNLRNPGRWTLGPVVGLDAGIFSTYELSTPAWTRSGNTQTALHAWPSIAVRAGRRF